MTAEIAFSRPLATVAALGDQAVDRHRFHTKKVLLTGDVEVLVTPNGRLSMIGSLLLLARTCKRGVVQLPAGLGELGATCRNKLIEIGCVEWQVVDGDARESARHFDATLSVGWRGGPDPCAASWTVVNAQGWLARVSSGTEGLPTDCGRFNPVGAVAAACLGTAEVFKTLVALKTTRGGRLPMTSFSLLTYTTGALDPGPELPHQLEIDAALCGGGAIGNGVGFLLSALPVVGRLWIVDRQTFGDENWGTCLLVRPTDIGLPKAEVLASIVRTSRRGVRVIPVHGEIREIENLIRRGEPRPRVVLGALDNVDARYDAQDLWPDLLIDGAIGDFPCQVSRHPWDEDVACIRCLFRPPAGASAQARASRATGLSRERVLEPDATVSDEDVLAAEPGRRDWLRGRVGKPICSVVQEAIAKELSNEDHGAGFEPSVPFVACMSAAMMVGELIKEAMKLPSSVLPRFQMDILRGPHQGDLFPERRRPQCLCVLRRGNIERLRTGGKDEGTR